MFLTTFQSRKKPVGENINITIEEFKQKLSTPIVTTETTEEYKALSKDEQAELKDKGGYIAGQCHGSRGKGCVDNRSAITLDLDDGDDFTLNTIESRCQYKFLLHSTRKHTPEQPRFRLIIPLSEPVNAKDYELLARTVAQDLGVIDSADNTTYQAERLMYWPTVSSDGMANYIFRENDLPLLNAESILNRYADKTDSSKWPRGRNEVLQMKTAVAETKSTPACEKPGLIGYFNTAYTIQEAIATFLSNVYAPVPNSLDRYSYLEAESTGGLVIYGDYCYSHHSSDPICGKSVCAFDLVRIHKFSELDEGEPLDTPIMDMPSQQAMLELARNDERVIALVKQTADAGLECGLSVLDKPDIDKPCSHNDWKKDLTYTKNGNLKNSLTNITEILRHDSRLQGIAKNEMGGNIIVTDELPWRKKIGAWTNDDMAQLNVFIDSAYSLYSPKKMKDALVTVAAEHSVHPIRNFLSNIEWDGIPRVDSLLIDYLGAEDTNLVRSMTRKTLVAAVARVFKPGIKFDTVLVLVGPQGIGKSTIFAKLGSTFFSDSLTLADMKDKTAAEKLAGYWIIELSELAGSKSAEAEMVKSFITRCDDSYRPAYGTVAESHPRQCIIVGTTNLADGFLYDTTGNRRFWPVNVKGGTKQGPWDLTVETIIQIWAEAKHYYDKGESLILEGDLAAEATNAQRTMLITDERVGIVQQYLDSNNLNEICKIAVWCDALNQPRDSYNMRSQREVGRIMSSLNGWHLGKHTVCGDYGDQRIYVRDIRTNSDCPNEPIVLDIVQANDPIIQSIELDLGQ